MCLWSPLADVVDDGDVGEEVVVLRRRHRSPQGVAVLEVAHQDAQAVQVRVLRSDDLEDGLREKQHKAEGHFTFAKKGRSIAAARPPSSCQVGFDSFFWARTKHI